MVLALLNFCTALVVMGCVRWSVVAGGCALSSSVCLGGFGGGSAGGSGVVGLWSTSSSVVFGMVSGCSFCGVVFFIAS